MAQIVIANELLEILDKAVNGLSKLVDTILGNIKLRFKIEAYQQAQNEIIIDMEILREQQKILRTHIYSIDKKIQNLFSGIDSYYTLYKHFETLMYINPNIDFKNKIIKFKDMPEISKYGKKYSLGGETNAYIRRYLIL